MPLSPQVQAAVDACNSEISAATSRVQADVKALNDKIAGLQAQIDAGNNDPMLLAALEDMKNNLAAIDPTNTATLASVKAGAQAAPKAPAKH